MGWHCICWTDHSWSDYYTRTKIAEKVSGLPLHTVVDNSSLPHGRRIQINSNNTELTKEECISLIKNYRQKAAPEGQVSVRKPSKIFKGNMTPWCVENFDGQGVLFHNYMF